MGCKKPIKEEEELDKFGIRMTCLVNIKQA
jgi:hypothetical protein